AAGRKAAFDAQRGSGDIAWRQPVAGRYGGDDRGGGKAGDEKRIAVEQPAKLDAGTARDLLLAAARQKMPGEAGDRRIAVGMGFGKPGLGANARCKAAG